MRVLSHSENGGKDHNEDFVIVSKHPLSSAGYVCLLADGQGGQSNGAAAARRSCEAAWALAAECPFDHLLDGSKWVALLEAADLSTQQTGGFTTLAGLAVSRELAAGASCGDSKVYFARPPAQQFDEWTQGQQKNPPVGSGEAWFHPFECDEPGDGRLLMVSDGVWKYCGYEALRAVFQQSDATTAIAVLRAGVVARSGPSLPDDFSVIAIDID